MVFGIAKIQALRMLISRNQKSVTLDRMRERSAVPESGLLNLVWDRVLLFLIAI